MTLLTDTEYYEAAIDTFISVTYDFFKASERRRMGWDSSRPRLNDKNDLLKLIEYSQSNIEPIIPKQERALTAKESRAVSFIGIVRTKLDLLTRYETTLAAMKQSIAAAKSAIKNNDLINEPITLDALIDDLKQKALDTLSPNTIESKLWEQTWTQAIEGQKNKAAILLNALNRIKYAAKATQMTLDMQKDNTLRSDASMQQSERTPVLWDLSNKQEKKIQHVSTVLHCTQAIAARHTLLTKALENPNIHHDEKYALIQQYLCERETPKFKPLPLTVTVEDQRALSAMDSKIDPLFEPIYRVEMTQRKALFQLSIQPKLNRLEKKSILLNSIAKTDATYGEAARLTEAIYNQLTALGAQYINLSLNLPDLQTQCQKAISTALAPIDTNTKAILAQHRGGDWSVYKILQAFIESLSPFYGQKTLVRFFQPDTVHKINAVGDAVDELTNKNKPR